MTDPINPPPTMNDLEDLLHDIMGAVRQIRSDVRKIKETLAGEEVTCEVDPELLEDGDDAA